MYQLDCWPDLHKIAALLSLGAFLCQSNTIGDSGAKVFLPDAHGLHAGEVSGEVHHVLDTAMTILLHAVEADDDKVGPVLLSKAICMPCMSSLPLSL